jgi:hypothetical protein
MNKTTFILHPDDRSTDFLTPLHHQLDDKHVITGGIGGKQIREHLDAHDQLILMGHGTANGLLSVGKFPDRFLFVVNEEEKEILQQKKTNILIWCYASSFARAHQIKSFCTGMFISEKPEATYLGLHDVSIEDIEISNRCFVEVVASLIKDNNIKQIYEGVMESEYRLLSKDNPVAKYNFDRIEFIT